MLGDQGGLALGQDDDAGAHFDFLGNGGEVAKHNEGLMEGVDTAVGSVPFGAFAGIGAQNVVKNQKVLIAQRFSGLGEIFDGGRVGADFGLGEDCSELHGDSLLTRTRWADENWMNIR